MINFKYLLLISFFSFFSLASFAYRPVAHIVLQKSIAQALPEGHILKVAMDSFPHFAAWGAVGPDIAYVPLKPLTPKWGYKRKIARLMNNANLLHYFKVGDFCEQLMRRAMESTDQRLIAFAAGWLTHVAGDFGAHGIYIYPEAGYYIQNPEGQDIHGELEQMAEAYVFIEKGKELQKDQDFYQEDNFVAYKLFEYFFDQPKGIGKGHQRRKLIEKEYHGLFALLNSTFKSLYGSDTKTDFAYGMDNYDEAFGKGVSIGKFSLVNYPDAVAYLKEKQLINLLETSFDYSLNYGVKLLNAVAVNDYSSFSNAWNLDVGERANTLIVRAELGEKRGDGSCSMIDLNTELDSIPVPLNNNLFEKMHYKRGDHIYSYLYLDSTIVDEKKQYTFTLEKNGWKDRTKINALFIYHNGKLLYENKEDIILNRKHPKSSVFKLKEPINLEN